MRFDLEYGDSHIPIDLPEDTTLISMMPQAPLSNPRESVAAALERPTFGPTLQEIIARLAHSPKNAGELTAAVAVSDNTRPVPYSCERPDGILLPLLEEMRRAGVRDENVTIVVGTGTHMATSDIWKMNAFGQEIVERFRIIDHDSGSRTLADIGVVDGIEVRVNEHFANAGLRIATSLAEPHFMAGVSGGAKAVCPGLINIETTRRFHGADWMHHDHATNLRVAGNPCFEFARKVARRVGVHFSVNCLINKTGDLCGLVTGELEAAHDEAVRRVRETAGIPCDQEYDVVITHGGKVAVNHYQAAKAAYAAMPILRSGGTLVLAAHNADVEPVGKPEYRELLGMLAEWGVGSYSKRIRSRDWRFVPDQWQVQKWDQFFVRAGGFDRLIYCTAGIPEQVLEGLPGRNGYSLLNEADRAGGQTQMRLAARMVQRAVDAAMVEQREIVGHAPQAAILVDGPYGVPILSSSRVASDSPAS